MAMTCADAEIRICDFLDGTLTGPQRLEFESHLSGCADCAELLKDSRAALEFIARAADVEPPAQLITRMFDIPRSAGGRAGAGLGGWLHGLIQPVLQPRLVMGLSLTILSFAMMARCVGIEERRLSPGDLRPSHVWMAFEDRVQRGRDRSVKFYENIRFVYKLQSKVRDWQQQQEQAEQKDDGRKLPARQTPEKTKAAK